MKRVKQIFIVLMFAVLLNGVSVYATGGDGTGSKDGGFKPLNFKGIELKDGTSIDDPKGIPLSPEFILKFDKNIVNMLVWEKNRKYVTLTTVENNKIPIIVSKIDDTVDFDHRQEIFVKPVIPLKAGLTYYIKVSPNLIAQNFKSTLGATTNGKEIKIAFKTKELEVKQDTKSEQEIKNKQNSSSSTPALSKTKNITTQKPKKSEQKDSIGELLIKNWLLSSTGLLLLCWAGFEVINYKKK